VRSSRLPQPPLADGRVTRKKTSSELGRDIAIFDIDRNVGLYLGKNCNVFIENGFNGLFQTKS
jgi:hypothetical protein